MVGARPGVDKRTTTPVVRGGTGGAYPSDQCIRSAGVGKKGFWHRFVYSTNYSRILLTAVAVWDN
eukprot:scaffold220118_cov50-Attheya_sp.AAC.1